MISPERFISVLRESDEYIKSIYLNGGCYQLHLILKVLYPSAEPWIVSQRENSYGDHIITQIGKHFYDITGLVKTSDYKYMRKVEADDISEIKTWSFWKFNSLTHQCPHCLEDIYISTEQHLYKDFRGN